MDLNAHSVESEAAPLPLRLEDSPAYQDEWSKQHPALSLLYHHDVITHLVWCAVACRYLTGGADGEVKIWRSEPSHARSAPAAFAEKVFGSAARPWLLPERHIMTLSGRVTGICVTDKDSGSSEVGVIAATDGTLTLCRTNTGEVVRTLRGARGESIESFRIPAVRARNGSAADAERGELASGRVVRRADGPSRSYAADAVSRRLAPTSDLAIVRRPVYTIQAYRDEVRDVFAGPSNGFFQGLRAVAPTYAHLAPHEETVADVLADFGIPAETVIDNASASPASTPRQWYASAVAVALAPETRRSTNTATDTAPPRDLYLFLGFPEGLLQVYVLPRRWFQLHLHGETRLDPPSLRFPILSIAAHTAAVLRIEVFGSKDLVVSVSEDGSTQLRRLSALHAPLRQLGTRIVPTKLANPSSSVNPLSLSFTVNTQPPAAKRGGLNQGHSRSVTCCCVDADKQLLITGSADHTLCWWSLMAGSPSAPTRIISLRDASSNLTDPAAASSEQPVVHGGYPIDVSFFYRRRGRHNTAATDRSANASGGTGLAEDAFFVLVLDTEQVVRVFDAVTGKLVLVRAEEQMAASAPSSGNVRVRHNVRLVRFDDVNGADRLLLGGLSLVPWYLTSSMESNGVNGHAEPIIFSAWCTALQCVVTADAHHVMLWRLAASSADDASEVESPGVEVMRTWRVSRGIRAITLCDRVQCDGSNSAAPSFVVAVTDQAVLVEYDCLAENPFQTSAAAGSVDGANLREPLALRQFVLQTEIGDISASAESATALAAAGTEAGHDDGHAGETSAAAMTYVAAVCLREAAQGARDGVGNHAATQGRVLLYRTLGAGASASTADISGSDFRRPSREIYLSNRGGQAGGAESHCVTSEAVSVLPVPSSRLLVLGGRQLLYVAPLFGLTSTAIPCTPLSAVASTRQGRKSSGLSWSISSCAAAIFPGQLSCYDDDSNITRSPVGNGVTTNPLAAAVASSTASLEGYLSRLVHLNDCAEDAESQATGTGVVQLPALPCLILSASNVGTLQLWDARGGAELWRCGVSLTQEPITALSAQQCSARWLVAVGDQAGIVSLLDLTSVVRAARRRSVGCGDGVRRESQSPVSALSSRANLADVTDAFMIDRWQAHVETVSGLCLAAPPQQMSAVHRLISTGEDTTTVVWTVPVLTNGMLGCATAGWRLFGQRPGYLLRPSTTEFPRATREAYAKLRLRYVRHSLFDRDAEFRSACTSFYTQPTMTRGDSAREEEALLDRAWDALVADVQALLNTSQIQPNVVAPALNASMVTEWCATLTLAAEKLSQSKSTSRGTTGFGGTVNRASLPTLSLLFAFADRCCSAAEAVPSSSPDRRSGLSSVVRESLRSALRAAVQSGVTTQRTLRTSPSPAPSSPAVALPTRANANAPAIQVSRPATELFSAVATITALAGVPPVGNITGPASGNAPVSAYSPPLVSPSIDLGISCPVVGDAPPLQATQPALSSHRVVPGGGASKALASKELSAANKMTGLPSPSLGYRVAYSTSVPLVRSAAMSPDSAIVKGEENSEKSPLHRRAARHSPLQHPAADHFGAASAQEPPFVDELADGKDSDALSPEDSDGVDNGEPSPSVVRAATVVERVHRGRRRLGDALQQLGANSGQQDDGESHFAEAMSAAKANRKLTCESISRYVMVKDSCRTLVDDDARSLNAVGDRRGVQGSSKATAQAIPQHMAHPVVSDTYLSPALSRARADASLGFRDADGGGRRTSSESSWFAMRQRKRDAAQESARLWNTPRVMRTLMGWHGTAPADDATGGGRGSWEPEEDTGQQMQLQVMSRSESRDGRVGAANPISTPSLFLPHILRSHAHRSHCDDLDGSHRYSTNALPKLLRVSPSAAIDAAVHPGLPTRAALQRERAAMQARMRQSVQQRAVQQRSRWLAAATMTAAASGSESPFFAENERRETIPSGEPADDSGDSSENSAAQDNLADDVHDPPLSSPETQGVPVASLERSASRQAQMSSSSAATVSTVSLSSRHKPVPGQQRKGLQVNGTTDPRRMATVPLPNATTRRELFAHRGGEGEIAKGKEAGLAQH